MPAKPQPDVPFGSPDGFIPSWPKQIAVYRYLANLEEYSNVCRMTDRTFAFLKSVLIVYHWEMSVHYILLARQHRQSDRHKLRSDPHPVEVLLNLVAVNRIHDNHHIFGKALKQRNGAGSAVAFT